MRTLIFAGVSVVLCMFAVGSRLLAQTTPTAPITTSTIPKDPGVRGGAPGAGQPLSGLSAAELAFFNAGSAEFQQVDTVNGAGGTGAGLGPMFNLDSCGGCHTHPAPGGSSPKLNP